jgi:hypothetical protein
VDASTKGRVLYRKIVIMFNGASIKSSRKYLKKGILFGLGGAIIAL